MSRYPAAVILLLALSGCARQPVRPSIPEKVYVPVPTPVPVDERLVKPCPVARAGERTVEAVVRAYNANVAALETCNKQISEIRALGR